MKHGSRALRAVSSSRHSHELRSRTLYGREVHPVYGVEIQSGDEMPTSSGGRAS